MLQFIYVIYTKLPYIISLFKLQVRKILCVFDFIIEISLRWRHLLDKFLIW